ncbi:MAG: type VI secretion system baseplate subunit TssG [Pseudomonadota bacterium]
MPTTQRRHHLSVIQRLLDEPYRYDFVQSLRVIEHWLHQNGVAHETALQSTLRFRNSMSMRFAPSQIEALLPVAQNTIHSDHGLQAALASGDLRHIRVTPAHMGFFGAHGVMPYCFTEHLVRLKQVRKFDGSGAFFDIFLNRLMLLHYQAWSKYRIHHRLDAQGKDALLPMQLALAGTVKRNKQEAANATDDEVEEEVAAHYAAVLRHRPVSARLLAGVLSEYFGVPFTMEQFVQAWDVLGDSELSKLGVQNVTLGKGAILGKRSRERHSRVRVCIGPLARADFDRFLPGASGNRALRSLLAHFALPLLDFELRLILRAADVKPIVLNADGAARLGMGIFLVTQAETRDRPEPRFPLLF